MPDLESWFREYPIRTYGNAVWYAPGIMRATATWRGLSLDGYLDGVATMSCANIGHDVWLKRPRLPWEGPFLVVDCARRNDIYGTTVIRQEVIEVGYRTAVRWGLNKEWRLEGVEVMLLDPNENDPDRFPRIHFPTWWKVQVDFVDTLGNRPVYRSPSTWRLEDEWVTFVQPTPPPDRVAPPKATLTPVPVLPKVEPTEGRDLSDLAIVTASVQVEEPMLSDVLVTLQELTSDQITQLSILVLFVTQVLKIVWYGLLKRPHLTKGQMRAFVFVLSIPVGYFFSDVALPSLDDPMRFAQDILAMATQVLVISGLVYEYLLQGLLGFVDDKVIKRTVLAP